MSYQEKKTVVSTLTGVLLLAAYCIYAFGKVQSGVAAADDLRFWATTMLIFIGIGIVASIVIQIVFHTLLSISMAVKDQIQNGKYDDKKIGNTIKVEMAEDEMNRLIGLKSGRIGYGIAGGGFIVALLSLLINGSPSVMVNIIYIALTMSSIIEGITQLYFYRKGVKNG